MDFNPVTDEPTLQLDEVSLRYKRSQSVLEGVDLVLEPQSFSILIGPSGAGKSSLLKLIYLTVRPTSGTLTLFGERIYNQSRNERARMRQRVGIVPQDLEFLDHLTLEENAALPLRVMGKKAKTYRDDVEELLVSLGLGRNLNAHPPELSAGQRQRLGIACALVSEPDLLLADEPTANVDPSTANRMLDLYLDINQRLGTTVLFATHSDDLYDDEGKSIYRLEKGKLTMEKAG